MVHRLETLFFRSTCTLICVFVLFQVSCQSSLSLTEDRPPDHVKTELGKDVTFGWDFSYKNATSIRNGPWEARGVLEISFGIWKSTGGRMILSKKIVTVDKTRKFEVRSGYENKMDWSHSVNKLTFKIKSFAIENQAMYGINVEFIALDQKSLTDTVSVETAAQYNRQTGNLTVRNETVYTSETVDLFFKRSVYDKTDDFLKYRIYKGHNISVITLGREENGKHGTCVIDPLLSQCQQRYSLRYVNKTYISFRLSNLTLLDSGLYILQAFFDKMVYNPEYAEIYLTVQEKPSNLTSVEPAHETSTPKAKSGQSGAQFSITFLLMLMISVQAFFHIGVVTC